MSECECVSIWYLRVATTELSQHYLCLPCCGGCVASYQSASRGYLSLISIVIFVLSCRIDFHAQAQYGDFMQVGSGCVRTGWVGLGWVRSGLVRLGQVSQVGSGGWVRSGLVKSGWVRFGQIGLGWIGLGQVRSGHVGSGRVRSG